MLLPSAMFLLTERPGSSSQMQLLSPAPPRLYMSYERSLQARGLPGPNIQRCLIHCGASSVGPGTLKRAPVRVRRR